MGYYEDKIIDDEEFEALELSIPFMGYTNLTPLWEREYCFQFPLWDTHTSLLRDSICFLYFQFPLWDTYNCT